MLKPLTKNEEKVFKILAATGRYLSTGKVLIGVSLKLRPRELSWNEEQLQKALLRKAK
tara:strand:- start:2676 stop:2849 length:174 start_codon:yes stop_codon:yes gene_type:complete